MNNVRNNDLIKNMLMNIKYELSLFLRLILIIRSDNIQTESEWPKQAQYIWCCPAVHFILSIWHFPLRMIKNDIFSYDSFLSPKQWAFFDWNPLPLLLVKIQATGNLYCTMANLMLNLSVVLNYGIIKNGYKNENVVVIFVCLLDWIRDAPLSC